ncbi:MAG: hypothetical protein V2J62_01355 [candidate division KSB1 bacterium]|jgi:hypothetical protein|nr:hypothetical protein [candidate division KSB1 bacterium]
MNGKQFLPMMLIMVMLLFHSNSFAQTSGLNSPVYIVPSWNIHDGDLLIQANSRIYYKNEVYDEPSQPVKAVTLWDAQGAVNLAYGLGTHLELGLSQILYQDAHAGEGGKGYNLPDDISIHLKSGGFGMNPIPLSFGFQLSTHIPLAKYHNIPLEPYTSKSVSYSLMTIVSYAYDANAPQRSLGAHLNLAYLDHNDSGSNLDQADGLTTKESSGVKELVYGGALCLPLSKFNFSIELYGNKYLRRPPEAAYSRYSYIYITPGISYSPESWYSFVLGIDYRVSSARPNISARTITRNAPVFPTWRMNLGVRFNLDSRLQKSRSIENAAIKNTQTEELDVFEQLEKERAAYLKAQEELSDIREERQRMDEMLERLKKVLNEDEDPKKE